MARSQNGVIHRDQCRAIGVHRSYVRNQLDAKRWTAWGDKVLLLQNARPSRRQLMWIAILDARPLAALCSHTSLELAGFRSFAAEAKEIHLLIPRGTKVTRFPGVVVHESRRLGEARWTEDRGLRRTEDSRSVIDAAAWQPWPRFACLMLAAAVQQRLCTPADLEHALSYVGRVRHKAYLRVALADIARGAHSLGELDVAAICRKFGLAPPERQMRRRDRGGDGASLTASGICLQERSSCLRSTAHTTWTWLIGRTTCGVNGALSSVVAGCCEPPPSRFAWSRI
jgi:hypothetical protein